MDDLPRVQRLAGICRRTCNLAPAALGTGIGIEEVFPGKLVDGFHTEFVALYKRLHRQRVGLPETPEVAARDGGQYVHVLAVRQIVQEGEQHDGMNPPPESDKRFRALGCMAGI